MTGRREAIGKRDVALAGALSLLGLLQMYDNVFGSLAAQRRVDPDAQAAVHVGNLVPYQLAIPLFLLVTVPLLWRRAAPVAASGAALAGLLVNEALIGTEVLRCGVLLPTGFLFAFTAGAQLTGPRAVIGLVLPLTMVVIDIFGEFGAEWAGIFGGVTAAMWGIGRVVRSRAQLAAQLRARTAELRQTRDERAALEVATDRARLSRELDQLLQRRLAELARRADEGAHATDAAASTAALAGLEDESRRTLEEMRAVVGGLRDDEDEVSTTPLPTLTHLEALLVQGKGGHAKLTVQGSPRVLPPAVELSAYRIVEHLLEALEDGPEVFVRVRFADDALGLEVSGRARRTAGSAIERARERARLQSGGLEATVRGGRAEAVVSLPVLVPA